MNIAVCVKQVPDVSEIGLDPSNHTLLRQGMPAIVNPCDRHALEAALRLRDEHGGKVTVISMGPGQAACILRECLAMGADAAVLLSDPLFAGSDTLATSRVLAAAIHRLGPFSMVVCGTHAIDGETGQVGPELAEWLGVPQLTRVTRLTVKGVHVQAVRETGIRREMLEAKLPVLVTVGATGMPRFPGVKGTLAARQAEIAVLTAQQLGLADAMSGSSPTRVCQVFAPERKQCGILIQEDTAGQAVDLLLSHLTSALPELLRGKRNGA